MKSFYLPLWTLRMPVQCRKLAYLAIMSFIVQSSWTMQASLQTSSDTLQPYVPINNLDGPFKTKQTSTESLPKVNSARHIQAPIRPHMFSQTVSPKLNVFFTNAPEIGGTRSPEMPLKTLFKNMQPLSKDVSENVLLHSNKVLHSYAKAPSINIGSSNNRPQLNASLKHFQKADTVTVKNSIFEVLASKTTPQIDHLNKFRLSNYPHNKTKITVSLPKATGRQNGQFVSSETDSNHTALKLINFLRKIDAPPSHKIAHQNEDHHKIYNSFRQKNSSASLENGPQNGTKSKDNGVLDAHNLDLPQKEQPSATTDQPHALFSMGESTRSWVVRKRSVGTSDFLRYANLDFLLPISLRPAEEIKALLIPLEKLAFLPPKRDLNDVAFVLKDIDTDNDMKEKQLAEDIKISMTVRQNAKPNHLRAFWELPLLNYLTLQPDTRPSSELIQPLQDSTSERNEYALLIPQLRSHMLSDEKRSKGGWRRTTSRRYLNARNGKRRNPNRQRMWSVLMHRSRDSQRRPLQVYRSPWRRNLGVVHPELDSHGRRPLETLGDQGSPHTNGVRELLIHRAHDASRSPLQELRHRSRTLYQIEQEIARRQLARTPLATRWTGTR